MNKCKAELKSNNQHMLLQVNVAPLVPLFIMFLVICSCSTKPGVHAVHSPDGDLSVRFQLIEGKPVISLKKKRIQVLMPSPIGIKLEDHSTEDFNLVDVISNVANNVWKPVWDKNSSIIDHHHESIFCLEDKEAFKLNIVIRVYDDAMAIRYEIPKQEGLDGFTISEDQTTFIFADDHTFWAANGERHNIGPASLSAYPDSTRYTPTVIQLGGEGFAALLEAAIYEFANFNLARADQEFALKCKMEISRGHTPAKTSWRVVLLGDDPGDLVESNTLVNLNPPCAIEDPTWIEPGKSVWDWRVWGYETRSGYRYGLNTESHKRLIDFAAANNIRYLLMDADWYGPEFSATADPTSANENIDIELNMAYAKSKDVGIILYLNDVGAKRFGLEKILKQFSEWGASGVKYGFMTTKGQEKVKYTREVVELCAKYKLTVNFHDSPLPPSGDRRTWPNLVTREYGHSQADAKRSYYPETVVNQIFINMITGPLDLCNGWFGFDGAESRDRVFEKIPGTVAAEVAKLAALFSGMHILPDAPEEYEKKSDLFDFLRTLPDAFDELRILDGAIDEFVSVGRRKGDDWYIGTLTNREAREVSIDCSFLEEDAVYIAMMYVDDEDSHFEHNREVYKTYDKAVEKGEVIHAKLAPGGGCAIRLIRQ